MAPALAAASQDRPRLRAGFNFQPRALFPPGRTAGGSSSSAGPGGWQPAGRIIFVSQFAPGAERTPGAFFFGLGRAAGSSESRVPAAAVLLSA
jgi:hypothetical protein